MAYLRELQHLCVICHKPAKFELVNTYNAGCGYYCAKHGKRRAAEMTAEEGPRCGATHRNGTVCDKPKGHKGKHSGEHPALEQLM